MKIQDILKQIDDMATPAEGDSPSQIAMRASRIRMLVAAADGESLEEAVRLHGELAIERLRAVVRRRIRDELSAVGVQL